MKSRKNKKEVFKVQIVDEVTKEKSELELAILVPTVEMMSRARVEQSLAFASAMEGKAPLRAKLDKYVRDQGIWDDDKQKEVEKLALTIGRGETKLAKGGIPLIEAKQIALNIRSARDEVNNLMSERNALDANTCEGQSENARFNSLVSMAIIYNDSGKPYFADLNDYLENSDGDIAIQAATIFARIYYGIDDDYYQQLPENQFLIRYKFCNKDLKLIDKQGRLVDELGSLVDEGGLLVNEEGSYVNYVGDVVDESGNVVIEALPFTNNDGCELDEGGDVIKTDLPAEKIDKKRVTRKKSTNKVVK